MTRCSKRCGGKGPFPAIVKADRQRHALQQVPGHKGMRASTGRGDAMRRHFRNVSIIDASGTAPFRGTVTVEGARIAAVTRFPSEPAFAPDDEVIDCTGFTLLPGLTEAHCHISFTNLTSIYSAVEIQPGGPFLAAAGKCATSASPGLGPACSPRPPQSRDLDVAVRDAINRGLPEGPRIRAAGQEITPTGKSRRSGHQLSWTFPRNLRFSIACDGADAFMKAARLAARDGVDTIKHQCFRRP